MAETAGWQPAWLPLSVQRAQRAEERAEAQQARESARALAERVESRRAADVAMFASEAEARGEYVDPVALATGRVTGRSAADVLESARMASEWQDAEAEREERRKRGERLQFVGLLEDPSARGGVPMTETRRAIERTSERFAASVAASQEAQRRRGELEDVVPAVRAPHWASGRRRSR
jgi:hypothetical protein